MDRKTAKKKSKMGTGTPSAVAGRNRFRVVYGARSMYDTRGLSGKRKGGLESLQRRSFRRKLIILGTVNGANFTDGLDGLAASVTVMTATFLAAASIGTGSRIEPAACAVAGALLGFLLFNVYPASVFMGDTGSLALGGFVAASAYMMRMQLFIPIISFIYLVEVVSVILQVAYFKLTGGKRLFRMAPLHHHFELCGWSETRIVAVFSILTAILCLVALVAI